MKSRSPSSWAAEMRKDGIDGGAGGDGLDGAVAPHPHDVRLFRPTQQTDGGNITRRLKILSEQERG